MSDDLEIEPRVIQRYCGGWLAVSHRDSPIKIGVTAQTEADARKKFAVALRRIKDQLAADRIRYEAYDSRTDS